METRGKRKRTVPVILTPEVVTGIDLLISTRGNVGVNPANPFIFACRKSQSPLYIRVCDCMCDTAEECRPALHNPDTIRSTKLRKSMATMSQLADLSETEVDWLARHLGHDIRVH